MDMPSLIMIAIALAMDAFAVSVGNGVYIKTLRARATLRFGLYFGLFQFGMTALGWALGSAFSEYITSIDHWIAFALLCLIGGKALHESFKENCGAERGAGEPDTKTMLGLAVATSIDALAVGVSLAVMGAEILPAAAVIGITSLLLSAAGVVLGHLAGNVFKKSAERVGAVILILMGFKILIEHLFFQ